MGGCRDRSLLTDLEGVERSDRVDVSSTIIGLTLMAPETGFLRVSVVKTKYFRQKTRFLWLGA